MSRLDSNKYLGTIGELPALRTCRRSRSHALATSANVLVPQPRQAMFGEIEARHLGRRSEFAVQPERPAVIGALPRRGCARTVHDHRPSMSADVGERAALVLRASVHVVVEETQVHRFHHRDQTSGRFFTGLERFVEHGHCRTDENGGDGTGFGPRDSVTA